MTAAGTVKIEMFRKYLCTLPSTTNNNNNLPNWLRLWKWGYFSSSLYDRKKADQTLALVKITQYMQAMLQWKSTNDKMIMTTCIEEGLG